eukprot:maker-scaffold292_size219010-snap-gene-0.23 protein:Tk00312 transcript:maker-scaffold292_size219010-snap-gene-0.23-mRNA-1 annotation:"oxidation resistance protein 1-like isoform x4"
MADEDVRARPTHHVVEADQCLRSIAALYDVTPSSLAQVNRLANSASMVFPGQTIRLPAASPPPTPTPPPAPKPRRPSLVEDDEIVDKHFIKINVRHITDGAGMVFGSLLITPKTLMFIPNVTDPLVQETKPDDYQVVAPLELVVNLAIFHDFGKFDSTFGIAVKENQDRNTIYEPHAASETEVPSPAASPPSPGTDSHSESPPSPPLYLRVVMGKPIAQRMPKTTPIMSYGRQTLQPEYWFILKGANAPDFYRFAHRLCPDKYGLLDHMKIERSGYEVIRPGVPLLEDSSGRECNRESVSRMMRKSLTMTNFDFDQLCPMIGESTIFQPGEREALGRELPPRADGHNWELYFSTTHDGFNLKSLLRKLNKHPTLENYDGPVILLIEDMNCNVFGAYLTQPPRFMEHFGGTGESFVFTVRPQFDVFHWTGENEYFLRCDQNNIFIGSGNGRFAIWLDGDLNQGRTEASPTFDNQPLTSEDFTLKTLECWAFVL